jgi:hypothetical protein
MLPVHSIDFHPPVRAFCAGKKAIPQNFISFIPSLEIPSNGTGTVELPSECG